MNQPIDYWDFDKAWWCFRDVNFWINSSDVQKTLKNLELHILNGILSPRERWILATIKNIPALNARDEICVSYESEVWSLFWISWVQVMFEPDEVLIRKTQGTNIIHTTIHVVKDRVDLTKRQVQGILVYTRNGHLLPEVIEIWDKYNLPVYK